MNTKTMDFLHYLSSVEIEQSDKVIKILCYKCAIRFVSYK
jgi:hypothetical protein